MSARLSKRFILLAIATTALLSATPIWAASGTWTQNAAGVYSWDTNPNSNWFNGIIADGAGNTADFTNGGNLDILGDITVNLDTTAHTIGTLLFGDKDGTTTPGSWIIGGSNTLTLNSNVVGTPALITVGPAADTLGTGKTVTISAPLTSTTTAGFKVNGAGTLVLNNTADNLSGPIILDSSAATGGLTFAATPTGSVGALQFGTVASGTATTNASTLTINSNVTASSLLTQVNSATSNTISIAAGKTLTISGPISVGFDQNGASANQIDKLIVVGASSTSSLVESGSGQTLTVGTTGTAAPTNSITSTLDLSGLNSFSFTGAAVNIGSGNRSNGTLILANSFTNPTNSIAVTTLALGGNNTSSNGGATNTLTLGGGTNTIAADTLNVGVAKSTSIINFPTGTAGSLTLGGNSTARTTINIGVDRQGLVGSAATSGSQSGTLDFTTGGTHSVNIQASTISIGERSVNSGSTNTGVSSGAFSMNAGTVDTTNLLMAIRSNTTTTNTGTGSPTGTLNIVGGSFTVSGTSALSFVMARNTIGVAAGTGPAGTINLTGGTLHTNANIVIDPVTGNATTGVINPYTAAININGGTLDMLDTIDHTTHHTIGNVVSGTNPVTLGITVTSTSGNGTLKDAGSINGATAGTVVVTKTGTGTLTIAGVNTYAGDTTINTTNKGAGISVTGTMAGNLLVNSSGSSSGTLAGNGNGSTSGLISGTVTLNGAADGSTGGRIAPGTTIATGQIGTLKMGTLVINGGELQYDLTTQAGSNDLINVGAGGVNFAGASQVSLGSLPSAGTYNLISLSGGGSFSNTQNKPSAPVVSATHLGFSTQISGNNLQLLVTGSVHNLTWTGSASSVWDITTTTQNWSSTGSTSTANDAFFNLDNVTFTDSPSFPGNHAINLNDTVQPGSITVNNSSGNDFSITSSLLTGNITGGTGITKQGTGKLTLGTANTYVGVTQINQGTVIVNSAGGITQSSGINVDGAIDGSATLQLGDSDATTNTGTNIGLGSSIATAPAITLANQGSFVVKTTAGTVAAANDGSTAVSVNNAIGGNGSVTINSPGGVVRLSGTNTYTGPTNLIAGILQVNDSNSLGSTTATTGANVTISSGAALDLRQPTGSTTTLNFGPKKFVVSGSGVGSSGAIIVNTNQAAALQNLQLANDSFITAIGGTLGVTGGSLDLGGFALHLNNGTFLLNNTAVNSLTGGDIDVDGAVFRVQNSSSVGGAGTIKFAGGTTLRLTAVPAGSITKNIQLTGNATISSDNAAASTVNSAILLNGDLSITTSATAGPSALTLAGNISEDATPRVLNVNGFNGTNVMTTILSGNNAFTGGVNIGNATTPGGILQLGSSGALNSSGVNAVTFGNIATTADTGLRLAGNSATISSLFSSSTPFIENASSTPATLTVNTTTTSSPTANTFAGTLQDGAGTGPLSFAVAGTGSMTLTGTSTNTGSFTVLGGGTLTVGFSPISSTLLNVQNGKLIIGGLGIPAAANLTLGDASNHNGLVDLNGNSPTYNSINTIGSGAANIINNTGSPVNLLIDGTGGAFSGVIKNDGGSIQLNVGQNFPTSLTLNGANTYTGGTNVHSGSKLTLGSSGSLVGDVSVNGAFVVNGSVAASSNVTLNGAGSTLSGTGVSNGAGNVVANFGSVISPGNTDSGGNHTPGTLLIKTLQTSGSDVQFNLPVPDSGTHDKVAISGSANLDGTTVTPLSPGSLVIGGSYTLFTYGSYSGSSGPTFNLPSNTRVNFTHPTGVNSIVLTVATTANVQAGQTTVGGASVTWVGAANSGTWDVGTSGTLNWSNNANGNIQTADDRFFNLDVVNFPEASTHRTVTLSANDPIQPTTVNVNNSTGSYTFTGSGSIGGLSTALNMTAGGSLIVATNNTYGGGTNISGGGTVQINDGGTLGTGTIGGTSGTLAANPISSQITVGNNIGGSLGLKQIGSGTTSLSGTNTYSGPTNIQKGTLQIGSAGGLPNGASVTLGSGANSGTLDVASQNVTVGALTTSGTGSSNSVIGSGTLTFSGGTSKFSGTISSALVANSGTLILTGTNSSLSNITTNVGGTLQIGDGGNAGSIGTNAISNDNGTLAYNHSDNLDLTALVINGTGGIAQVGFGNITLGANGMTGNSSISFGTATMTTNTSLGPTTGGIVNIANGGTLDVSQVAVNTLNTGTKQFVIAGAGVGGNGAIVNNGNSQSTSGGGFGSISLTADATINASQRIDMRTAGPVLNLNGHTLTIIGGNQFSLFTGTANDGTIDVKSGTLAFEQSATASNAGTGKIILENGSRLLINNDNNVSRQVQINGSAQIQTSSSSSSMGSNITLNSTAGLVPGNVSFFGSTVGTTMTMTGNISETTPSSLTMDSPGATTLLSGSSSYTGPTNVARGTLNVAGSLSSPTLVFSTAAGGGGALILSNTAAGTIANFTGGTTVNPGSSAVANAAGVVGTTALGTISRSVGGTLDFSVAGGTMTATSGAGAAPIGNILGGWATFNNGADWAALSGGTSGNVVGYSSLFSYSSTWSGNSDVPSGTPSLAGGTTNSVRFNSASALTVTGAGPNIVSSGGILVTPTVGANPTSLSGSGSLTSGSSELIVNQYDATAGGNFTIGSKIVDANGGTTPMQLTKSGNGVLILANNTNSYTGGTRINGGTVRLGAGTSGGNSPLGSSTASVSINNGIANTTTLPSTLDLNGNDLTLGSILGTGGVVNTNTAGVGGVTPGTVTLTIGGDNAPLDTVNSNIQSGAIAGPTILPLALVKNGTGTVVLAGGNAYTGGTTINGGFLQGGAVGQGAAAQANGLPAAGNIMGNINITSPSAGVIFSGGGVYSDVISGSGSVTKIGNANLTIGNSTNSLSQTYTGPTTVSGGTLTLGIPNALSASTDMILGGGTLVTGIVSNTANTPSGLNQTFKTLQVKGNSIIDMGNASSPDTLAISNSSSGTWTAGAALKIANWTSNIDVITLPAGGLSASELSRVKFNNYLSGAKLVVDPNNSSVDDLVPINTTPLLLGDVNGDGTVSVADISALMVALSNPSAYMTQHTTSLHTFTNFDFLDVADTYRDGVINNLDIQGEISMVANGGTFVPPVQNFSAVPVGGSVTAVPEPASFALLGLGGLIFVAVQLRKRKLALAR